MLYNKDSFVKITFKINNKITKSQGIIIRDNQFLGLLTHTLQDVIDFKENTLLEIIGNNYEYEFEFKFSEETVIENENGIMFILLTDLTINTFNHQINHKEFIYSREDLTKSIRYFDINSYFSPNKYEEISSTTYLNEQKNYISQNQVQILNNNIITIPDIKLFYGSPLIGLSNNHNLFNYSETYLIGIIIPLFENSNLSSTGKFINIKLIIDLIKKTI